MRISDLPSLIATFSTLGLVSTEMFCSSEIQCAIKKQTVCNGVCITPYSILSQDTCPCVVVTISSCQILSKICIEVFFEDQQLVCRDWRSSNANAIIIGSKDVASVCLNSTSLIGSDYLWCYKNFIDPDPMEILFIGPNAQHQELCSGPRESYYNSSKVIINITLHINTGEASNPLLTPNHCICPINNYTCSVTKASGLSWHTSTSNMENLKHLFADDFLEAYVEIGGFGATFNKYPGGNYNSSIRVQDIKLNGTNLTCHGLYEGESVTYVHNSVTICCIGPSSAPRDLSVVWDDPYAVVSFQSPVYGGECVEYYMVTAVSEEEERNISCNVTISEGDRYSCSIFLNDSNMYNYNFTAYGVTPVNESFRLIGESTGHCCIVSVNLVTRECGKKDTVNVTWEERSENTIISWRVSSGPTHYERVDSESYHLLTLDYSETGAVKIAVTFSSPVCNTTSVITYLDKRILRNVSLKFPILVIESRDCIASPENYRTAVTSTDSTQLVNVSFNTTIEQDVGDVVRPNTQYTIRVQIVHISSNTIIDEMNQTILYIKDTLYANTLLFLSNSPTPFMPGVNKSVKNFSLAITIGLTVGLLLLSALFALAIIALRKRLKTVKGGFPDTKLRTVNLCPPSNFQSSDTRESVVYESVDVGRDKN